MLCSLFSPLDNWSGSDHSLWQWHVSLWICGNLFNQSPQDGLLFLIYLATTNNTATKILINKLLVTHVSIIARTHNLN